MTHHGRTKLGILIWPQYTEWQPLFEAGQRADELGYDSLWTWDHLYPIVGSPEGPIFEGYLTLAAWAGATRRATLGLMVGANTFRNPALTAKMATTLDHISGGRAVLGIGGAWFDTEHTAYGIDFGAGFGERLDRLDEAVEIMHGMLHGQQPSGRGIYETQGVRNDPPPVQAHLPILIGGGGEKKTIRTVARFADAWNIGGDVEQVRRKEEVLLRWCEEVGRDPSEIERTLQAGNVVLRSDEGEARRVAQEIGGRNGGWRGPEPLTSVEPLVERLAPIVQLGFRHLYFDLSAPFDPETMERLATEFRPLMDQAAGTGGTAAGATPAVAATS